MRTINNFNDFSSLNFYARTSTLISTLTSFCLGFGLLLLHPSFEILSLSFPATCGEIDSPDAKGETVPTVSRSESVLGLCTVPCPSTQTTALEILPLHSKRKGYEILKYPAERQQNYTEKQL